jgi:hypothetical protein
MIINLSSVGRHDIPISGASIGHNAMQFLRCMPNLRSIESLIYHDRPICPNKWDESGRIGCIIRTYKDKDQDHQLVHIRCKTPRCTGLSYDLDKHVIPPRNFIEDAEPEYWYLVMDEMVWMDATDFEGKMVPDEVLLEVYRIAGTDADWRDGGRGLSLPEECWEILRQWRWSEEGDTEIMYID